MKNLLVILVIFVSLQSCVTYQKCKEKYLIDTTSNNGVKKVIVDEKIPVKGETKNGEVDLEDLLSDGVVDTNGQSVLTVYVTDTIRLNDTIRIVKYKVKVKDRLVPVHDTIYVPYECPPTNNFKDQDIWQKIYDNIKWWHWVILVALIFVTGYLINAWKSK